MGKIESGVGRRDDDKQGETPEKSRVPYMGLIPRHACAKNWVREKCVR